MKKNRNKLSKYKVLLCCVFICLLFVFGITIGRLINANAEEESLYIMSSDGISYDNTQTGINANNAEEALNYLYTQVGQCPEGYTCTKKSVENVLKYDENSSSTTYCVTGNESTCVADTCVDNGTECQAGTIIDYKVNDTEMVRFHVLHDDGDTMTLQAQKNTVYNTSWWAVENNQNEGPQTIMAELKRVTNGWKNVKDITLADGMTQFNDGTSANNNCEGTSCSVYTSGGNGYPYSKLVNNASIGSTVKARMITITETAALGCTTFNSSCPIYLYNYLRDSVSYCRVSGKCTNDTHTEHNALYNNGYWTMGAMASNLNYAWSIGYYGRVVIDYTASTNCGARAVVVVDK